MAVVKGVAKSACQTTRPGPFLLIMSEVIGVAERGWITDRSTGTAG
jgi:hypothetical protein